MNESCIRKTKTVLNKMFDLTLRGYTADVFTAEILFHYYEYLRTNGYTLRKMYWDVQAARETISDWRSLNDPQLPKTYEKNLLLAGIFSCEIEDIVFTEYDADSRAFDFELSFDFRKTDDVSAQISLYLPRIRVKAGERGDKFVMDDDMVNECYARVSKRRVAADGLTLLDRAQEFIERYDCRSTAGELIKSLKAVYFNWLNGKTPSSLESLRLFSLITGLEINDLYKPIYEYHTFDITLPRGKSVALGKLRVGESMRRTAELYLQGIGADIVKCGSDYAVTKKNDRYGILVFDESYVYYLDHEYDYVLKDRDTIITVSRATIGELEVNDLPMLLRKEDTNVRIGFNPMVRMEQLVRAVAFAGVFGRYGCRKIQGGLLIVDRQTGKVTVAGTLPRGGGRTLVSYKQGKPSYGGVFDGVLIPPEYDEKVRYSNGIFTVCREGKYGFLNAFGFPICEPTYEDASIFQEERIAVKHNGKYGYVDENNAVVIDFTFDAAGDFSDGLAAVETEGKVGYIDREGNFAISPAYDSAFRFSEGVAVVEKNGKYGYIDRTGATVLPPIYEEATACKNGNVKLLSCGRLINKSIGGMQK